MWIYQYKLDYKVIENQSGELASYSWVVGFFTPTGYFETKCWFETEEEAWAQTSYLNGGSNPVTASAVAQSMIAQAATYQLTSPTNIVTEGDQLCINLITTGVAQGTTVSWYITGLNSADILTGLVSGEFIVNNNQSQYCMDIVNDQLIEGTETLTFSLANGADSLQVTVLDGPIQGCTDPTALNYDSSATVDDGTCTYASNNTGKRV